MPTAKSSKSKVQKSKVAKAAAKPRSTSSVRELPKETGFKLSVYDLRGAVVESITLPKEIFDAKIDDVFLALEPEFLLDQILDRQAVAIPSPSPVHTVTTHCLVARNGIFDQPS